MVRGTVPAEEFALRDAVESVPDMEFEIERVVDTGEGTVMPLLWVRGVDRHRADEAFAADATVAETELVGDFDEELLYRMEWSDRVDLLLRMVTNHRATVLDAFGTRARWQLRVMYPDREGLSATHEFCHDHGLSFDVESVREMDGEPAGRFGLTADQFRALTTAAERGLFAVPREVTLEELAEEFDVTHQALSERIRRATGALVEDALLVGPVDSE